LPENYLVLNKGPFSLASGLIPQLELQEIANVKVQASMVPGTTIYTLPRIISASVKQQNFQFLPKLCIVYATSSHCEIIILFQLVTKKNLKLLASQRMVPSGGTFIFMDFRDQQNPLLLTL